jgi:hypothetical protein
MSSTRDRVTSHSVIIVRNLICVLADLGFVDDDDDINWSDAWDKILEVHLDIIYGRKYGNS